VSETLKELLVQCGRGEEPAVATLVARYHEWALALAEGILRDGHLAEDAVQAAFVRALGALGELRDAEAFAGWLRQIIRTECHRIARARRDGAALPELAGDSEAPVQAAARRELAAIVRTALRQLPESGRSVAELYYLEERDCAAVAALLQVPRGTVKRRLFDARRALRELLRPVVDDEMANVNRRQRPPL
jgi:RNA polymerase sigma factor (sigma-70 family)